MATREPLVVHQVINAISAPLGAEHVTLWLHRGLLARGHRSTLVTLAGHADVESGVALAPGASTAYHARALPRLVSYLRRAREPRAIVHVHLFVAVLIVSVGARLAGWPGYTVYTEHNTKNRRRTHPLGPLIDHVTYSGIDRVACVSGATHEELVRWKPSCRKRSVVIENGVPRRFQDPPTHDGEGRLRILSIGRLHPNKNYETALRAVAMLSDVDVEYLIAGEGDERGALTSLAAELGISDRVRFLGHVEDVGPLLATSHVMLMPSRVDGFGVAAVEGMNAGLPVVAGDVPGLREVVGADASCALLADPNRPEAFATHLRKLLTDEAMRARLGVAGHARAERFSIDGMVDAYVALYESLVSSPR